MTIIKSFVVLLFSVALIVPSSVSFATEKPRDANALQGVKVGKAIYDVRTNSPKSLLFILKVIEQTENGMKEQGVEPDFILSFRGGTLPLLTHNPEVKGDADKAILEEVRERLGKMRSRGMVLEACNVAAGLFKIEKKDLADDLTLIGNSLISLIGYQHKGYALVPMY